MALSNLDRDLLHRCLEQDPYAWESFVDRFIGLVTHVVNYAARCRAMPLSSADREDLIAEVFAALLEQDMKVLRRFEQRSSLATYLAVIARRVTVQRLLHPATRRLAPLDSHRQEDPAPNHEERIGNREEVEQMLGSLESPEAEVIRMFHLEGKSYREISRQVGVPENSIGPMLSRTRARLRRRAGVES